MLQYTFCIRNIASKKSLYHRWLMETACSGASLSSLLELKMSIWKFVLFFCILKTSIAYVFNHSLRPSTLFQWRNISVLCSALARGELTLKFGQQQHTTMWLCTTAATMPRKGIIGSDFSLYSNQSIVFTTLTSLEVYQRTLHHLITLNWHILLTATMTASFHLQEICVLIFLR